MRAAYYQGVRLWGACQHFPGWASRTGEHDYQGFRQTYKGSNPESGNFERPLRVETYVESQVAVSGYSVETSIDNTLHAVEALLLAVQTSLGWLSWCEDDAKRASVTAGGAAGAAVVITLGARQGGWTVATGDLVLVRKGSTGAGWVTPIAGVAGDNVTLRLDSTIDNTWEVILVQRAYAQVAYLAMDGGKPRDAQDSLDDRQGVTFDFKGFGAVSTPSASLLSGYTR